MGTPARQTQPPTLPPPLSDEERTAVRRLMAEWIAEAESGAPLDEPEWNPDELFPPGQPRCAAPHNCGPT